MPFRIKQTVGYPWNQGSQEKMHCNYEHILYMPRQIVKAVGKIYGLAQKGKRPFFT